MQYVGTSEWPSGSLTPDVEEGIGTGWPDKVLQLFYNQIVIHLCDTLNATGNFSGLFDALR